MDGQFQRKQRVLLVQKQELEILWARQAALVVEILAVARHRGAVQQTKISVVAVMTDTEILDYLESQLRVPMPSFYVLPSTGGVPPQEFVGWSINRSDTAYPTLREAVEAMRDQARSARYD